MTRREKEKSKMHLSCSCNNEFQDKFYGKGIRMFNDCKSKSPGTYKYRCTSCLKEVTLNNNPDTMEKKPRKGK